MTNKQLNEGHSMNFEREEAKVRLLRLIAEDAMATHAGMVAAGKVEESSDPLVMFGRGVAHAVGVMMIIREEYNIDAEEEAVRAANN